MQVPPQRPMTRPLCFPNNMQGPGGGVAVDVADRAAVAGAGALGGDEAADFRVPLRQVAWNRDDAAAGAAEPRLTSKRFFRLVAGNPPGRRASARGVALLLLGDFALSYRVLFRLCSAAD
jgi:hypothetical protein